MTNAKLFLEIVGLFLLIPILVILFSFNYFPQRKDFPKSSQRDMRVSFLRGISIIGIVIIHIDSYLRFFHDDDFTKLTLLLSNFSRFSVPIFFITSSLFLSWKGWHYFLTNRVLYLLVPYFFISLFGYFIKNDIKSYSASGLIYQLLTGSVFEPFYFILVLLQIYFFHFFIRNVQWSTNLKIFAIVITLILNLLANNLERFVELPPELIRICSLNFIFFFMFGFLFKNFLTEFSCTGFLREFLIQFTNLFFLSGFMILLTFTTYKMKYQMPNYHLYYPIGAFLFLLCIFPYFEKNLPKFTKHISYIGDNSISIFLLHPLIIHFFHSVDPYFLGNKILAFILVLVVNIYLPLLIFYLGKLLLKKQNSS